MLTTAVGHQVDRIMLDTCRPRRTFSLRFHQDDSRLGMINSVVLQQLACTTVFCIRVLGSFMTTARLICLWLLPRHQL